MHGEVAVPKAHSPFCTLFATTLRQERKKEEMESKRNGKEKVRGKERNEKERNGKRKKRKGKGGKGKERKKERKEERGKEREREALHCTSPHFTAFRLPCLAQNHDHAMDGLWPELINRPSW